MVYYGWRKQIIDIDLRVLQLQCDLLFFYEDILFGICVLKNNKYKFYNIRQFKCMEDIFIYI